MESGKSATLECSQRSTVVPSEGRGQSKMQELPEWNKYRQDSAIKIKSLDDYTVL